MTSLAAAPAVLSWGQPAEAQARAAAEAGRRWDCPSSARPPTGTRTEPVTAQRYASTVNVAVGRRRRLTRFHAPYLPECTTGGLLDNRPRSDPQLAS
jgi:hypothetical protein